MKTVKWTLYSMIVCAVIVTFQMTALAADTDALVVDETGNVGIGTDIPQQKLDVNGTAKIGNLLIGPWPASSNYAFFGNAALDQSVSGNFAILQNNTGRTYINSPTDIRFRINNQDQMQLTDNGFLGVGTALPRSKIHVVDSGNQTTSFTGQNAGTLSLYGGSYVQDGYTNLDFSNNGTGGVIGRIGVRNNGQGSYLTLGTSNHYGSGITNEALTIDPWGKVGIGIANPQSKGVKSKAPG